MRVKNITGGEKNTEDVPGYGGNQLGWHNIEAGTMFSSKICKILAQYRKQNPIKKTKQAAPAGGLSP